MPVSKTDAWHMIYDISRSSSKRLSLNEPTFISLQTFIIIYGERIFITWGRPCRGLHWPYWSSVRVRSTFRASGGGCLSERIILTSSLVKLNNVITTCCIHDLARTARGLMNHLVFATSSWPIPLHKALKIFAKHSVPLDNILMLKHNNVS